MSVNDRSATTILRTLQIGNDWPGERVGGLNRYFSELLRHLPETGTEVRGLVVGPAHIQEETQGIVRSFARSNEPIYKRIYKARQETLRALAEGKTDLLVSHFALYCPWLGPWHKKVPLAVHFHGPWAAESNVEGAVSRELRMKTLLERSVYRRAARLIVLSKSFQQELVSRYGIEEERTRIVPGGIDLQRFTHAGSREEARVRLGWPAGRPTILAVRRMVRRMGLENLIDAMREVSRVHPEVLLLLGGKGPIAEELHRRVDDYQLDKNVQFLGRIEESDLPSAYRAADMTVVPSQALEGFGMITLESLACGTPALVTPVGGLPEIMRPFAPQCVFPDTTTKGIEAVLLEVLSGSRKLPNTEACRAYADTFSWPRIAAQVRMVYNEATR